MNMAIFTPTVPISPSRPEQAELSGTDLAGAKLGGDAALWLRRLAAFCFGLWLAWGAISVQLAARAVQAGLPAAALVLNARSTTAETALADAAMLAGRPTEAVPYAIDAVGRAPYSAHSVRTIGLIDAVRGDDAGSTSWLSLAGGLGWRDVPTQIWISDRLLAAARYEDAFPHLEAILRQQEPEQASQPILPVLNRLASIPQARAAMIDRLVQLPPWRGVFMTRVAALAPADFAGREALIGDLRTTASPVTRAELQPYVSRLFTAGEHARARTLWLDLSADRRWVDPAGVYDGGFDVAPDGVPFPFEWQIPSNAEAFAAIEPDAAGDSSLHISATGEMPPTLIEQHLLLSAGSYELTAQMVGSKGADAVHWEMHCVDGAPIPMRNLTTGRHQSASFVVPPGNCPVQRLELRYGRLGGAEPVDLRFDNIVVRQVHAS